MPANRNRNKSTGSLHYGANPNDDKSMNDDESTLPSTTNQSAPASPTKRRTRMSWKSPYDKLIVREYVTRVLNVLKQCGVLVQDVVDQRQLPADLAQEAKTLLVTLSNADKDSATPGSQLAALDACHMFIENYKSQSTISRKDDLEIKVKNISARLTQLPKSKDNREAFAGADALTPDQKDKLLDAKRPNPKPAAKEPRTRRAPPPLTSNAAPKWIAPAPTSTPLPTHPSVPLFPVNLSGDDSEPLLEESNRRHAPAPQPTHQHRPSVPSHPVDLFAVEPVVANPGHQQQHVEESAPIMSVPHSPTVYQPGQSSEYGYDGQPQEHEYRSIGARRRRFRREAGYRALRAFLEHQGLVHRSTW